tara:strand:- start:2462 stop:2632 length:171 start_codon:yes stop_codon:yes gene_type:complete
VLKVGSFVVPKIPGVLFKNEPCYVVIEIKKEMITIEQKIGCYSHKLTLHKSKLEVL